MGRTKCKMLRVDTKKLRTIEDLDLLNPGDSINAKNDVVSEKLIFITKHATGSYEFVRQIWDGLKFYLIQKKHVYVEKGCLKQNPLSRIPSFTMGIDNPANIAYFQYLENKLNLRWGIE